MSNHLTPEFLATHGFRKKQFPDGFYWVRHYTSEYFLQASEDLTDLTEFDNAWIEELTADEFFATIMRHERAINQ